MRDNGPIFVADPRGAVSRSCTSGSMPGASATCPTTATRWSRRLAAHLGSAVTPRPFVLEGGSFFVDGEGTLLTTEQCLLNPNRNPA